MRRTSWLRHDVKYLILCKKKSLFGKRPIVISSMNYSSLHLKWIKTFSSSCPKTKMCCLWTTLINFFDSLKMLTTIFDILNVTLIKWFVVCVCVYVFLHRFIPTLVSPAGPWASWTRLLMMCSSASLQRPHGSLTITSGRPSRAERCRPQSGCCCPENSPNTRCQRAPRPSPNTPAPSDHLWAVQEQEEHFSSKKVMYNGPCLQSLFNMNKSTPWIQCNCSLSWIRRTLQRGENEIDWPYHMWPWTTKVVLSRWGIFVAIAKNALYGSKLSISFIPKIIRILSKDCAPRRYFVSVLP